MYELPVHVPLLFLIAAAFTAFAFYRAARNSKTALAVMLAWIVLQSAVSLTGFYLQTDTVPPRFPLMPVPPLILILVLFTTRWGRRFTSSLDMSWLTWLHVVRVPVEMVLFWLCGAALVPQLMTFEGRNFDILSGITAPVVYYFAFRRGSVNHRLLIAWNLVCLVLLLNIVVNAVLSAPGPLQRQAFEQPNVGVLMFPYALLPAFIVPVVLLAHLAALRQLFTRKDP